MLHDNEVVENFYWVEKKQNNSLNPNIRIALEKASEYEASAVYFRIFEDNRPPIPQIYIYDFTGKPLNEQYIFDNHHRIWSSCQVPLIFVFTNTDLKIINAFEAPGFQSNQFQSHYFETFELVELLSTFDKLTKGKNGKIFKDFTAKNFDNGSFWDNESVKKDFIVSKNAYESLIKKLKEIRQNILCERIFDDEKLANKLLVMSILVKYLEERKDNDDNTVFPKKGDERLGIDRKKKEKYQQDFFNRYSRNAEEFIEIFENKEGVINLFRDLSKHFNGEIFKLSSEEESAIKNANLRKFAEFLEAKTENEGQRVLWKLYSFNDLPVELISNIYENLIVEGKHKTEGVVYTPPFLVNFLLDEVMPLTDPNTDFKILDPACGSGIFLVQAYKRLIYRWKIVNNWKKPKIGDLKELLLKNIHGIDVEEDAIRVTAFSLTLALCDELSPLEIWDNLQFDDLKQNNLFYTDFFLAIDKNQITQKFDLVIGNPPFNITSTPSFERILSKWQKQKINIPDKNPALAFLAESVDLCKENGQLCLILPSGPFLYNLGSFGFRRHFIKKYKIDLIADFTHLSRFLFGSGKGDHPTIALFLQNESPKGDDLLHLTVRRTKSVKEKVWIELDKYDFHYVPLEVALSNDKENNLIWKSNFIGGGRIFSLSKKLEKIRPKIDDYETFGWKIREGYQLGNKKSIQRLKLLISKENLSEKEKDELEKLSIRFKRASFITGKKSVQSKNWKLSKYKEITQMEEFFRTPTKEEIYEPPLLLVKQIAEGKNLLVKYSDDYLTYDEGIVGISAPLEEKSKLLSLSNLLNSKTYLFQIIVSSSAFAIRRSSVIDKVDISNLPFPQDTESLKLNKIEQIIVDDTIDIFLPFRRQHAGLTEAEINVTSKPTYLNQYAEIFLNVINSVYKEYKAAHWISTDNHVVFPFYWGDKSSVIQDGEKLENHLGDLLKREKPEANLRFVRVLTIYDENVIYLIKPKQYRYWLRSVAIRDADETFAYLVKQEYNL